MKNCSLNDFVASLKPWLAGNYIRKAYINEKGDFVLHFLDNVTDVYHIDDCDDIQIRKILADLEKKGVTVSG